MFEPPKCPRCGYKLDKVHETVREVYRFRPEDGVYEVADGEAEMMCPECGGDLYDIFPHGACNFHISEYVGKDSPSKISLILSPRGSVRIGRVFKGLVNLSLPWML